MPTRGGGPPVKKPIPHVKRVIAVASGEGGVGKSTVAGMNEMLHCSLPILKLLYSKSRYIIGFEQVWPQTITCWPSGPRHFWSLDTEAMGLENVGEPALTKGEHALLIGALLYFVLTRSPVTAPRCSWGTGASG